MTDRARSEFNTWWERQPFKDQFADVKEQMGNVWVASREMKAAQIPEWSGWAVQYPGKLPKLYGALEIAELNWCPDEGADLIKLAVVERMVAKP
ncbi:hypothetical protein [Pseudomonas massiliensis]|nr:hypothetical protein [Pseudomonas massiliensis]